MSTSLDVSAPNATAAWARACRTLLEADRSAFHLVVRIGIDSPDHGQQSLVDGLLAQRGLQPSETVANTIFPTALAQRCATLDELAERYLALYPRLRKHRPNARGTYFGRLIDFPDAGRRANQLAYVVEKLKREAAGSHKTSIYECSIYSPSHDAGNNLGFPCMSSCAFHLDPHAGLVHLVAVYRNQHLLERGLGNYLGLTRLRNYIAAEAGLGPGELMVIAGHALLDAPVGSIRNVLQDRRFEE